MNRSTALSFAIRHPRIVSFGAGVVSGLVTLLLTRQPLMGGIVGAGVLLFLGRYLGARADAETGGAGPEGEKTG